MKEFKLQSSIKFVLFVFALTIALVVLWINNTIISNLREGNRQQLEKVAKSYSQSISNSTDEELAFIINILLRQIILLRQNCVIFSCAQYLAHNNEVYGVILRHII